MPTKSIAPPIYTDYMNEGGPLFKGVVAEKTSLCSLKLDLLLQREVVNALILKVDMGLGLEMEVVQVIIHNANVGLDLCLEKPGPMLPISKGKSFVVSRKHELRRKGPILSRVVKGKMKAHGTYLTES